jgi:hypothetical protein
MFFVATAPLTLGGHVNVAPKGLRSLALVDETSVVYVDLTGSGIDCTRVQENGRTVDRDSGTQP